MSKVFKIAFFGIILLMAALKIATAHTYIKPPAKLLDYKISMIDPETNTVGVSFTAEMRGSGFATAKLHLPREIVLLSNNDTQTESTYDGSKISRKWKAKLTEDGYFMVQVGLTYQSEQDARDENRLAGYHTFPMYLSVEDKNIIECGRQPDQRLNEAVKIVDNPGVANKSAQRIPLDPSVRIEDGPGVDLPNNLTSSSNTIIVYIAGKIQYLHEMPC